jgi:hypothetical protein
MGVDQQLKSKCQACRSMQTRGDKRMSMWLMYLILKLDDVATTFGVISVVGLLFATIATIFLVITTVFCICDGYTKEDCNFLTKAAPLVKKYLIRLWIVVVVCGVLSTFLPTTKQAAAIYFIPKVINNKQVRKMPNKLVVLANDWMDEQIKTIKSK